MSEWPAPTEKELRTLEWVLMATPLNAEEFKTFYWLMATAYAALTSPPNGKKV